MDGGGGGGEEATAYSLLQGMLVWLGRAEWPATGHQLAELAQQDGAPAKAVEHLRKVLGDDVFATPKDALERLMTVIR